MYDATFRNDDNPPPTLEESYGIAANTSDLTVEDPSRGPARLLIASGMAMHQTPEQARAAMLRPVDRPNIRLGHALARLQSEWQGCEKPQRHKPKSVKCWTGILPKIQTGERQVQGKRVPIMTRDTEGARAKHLEELQTLDVLYEQELKYLAQKLPSRQIVREWLYRVAVHWGWEDAEERVAEVLRHWLDDNCGTCHGTGKVVVGIDNTVTCPDCGGKQKVGVPHGGAPLHTFIVDSLNEWKKNVTYTAKVMRNS